MQFIKALLLIAALLWPLQSYAAISFIGSAEGSSSANTDTTVTLPGSMAVNDLILIACGIGDNDAVDQNMAIVTTGYTEVVELLGNNAGTQDVNFLVAYKFHNGSDTTVVCDALSAGTDAAVAAVVMVFRGVATVAQGGPFDVTSTSTTGNGFSPDPPSIDWSTANTWVVIAGGSGHTLGGAGTYTFPTNYTTNAIDRGHDDTSDVTVGMGYRTAPSDPEDPGVMTHSGSNDTTNFTWAAVTLALKEFVAPACTAGLNLTILGVGGCP